MRIMWRHARMRRVCVRVLLFRQGKPFNLGSCLPRSQKQGPGAPSVLGIDAARQANPRFRGNALHSELKPGKLRKGKVVALGRDYIAATKAGRAELALPSRSCVIRALIPVYMDAARKAL